ncbi:MAG: transposase, partial [Desulfobulbus propionicus]
GRPCGDSLFVDQLENLLGRKLKPQKPGPKVKN